MLKASKRPVRFPILSWVKRFFHSRREDRGVPTYFEYRTRTDQQLFETLEDRTTPTVRVFSDAGLTSLVATYTGPAAIDTAIQAGTTLPGYFVAVDNDQPAYSDVRITKAVTVEPYRAPLSLTNPGVKPKINASNSFFTNVAVNISSGLSGVTFKGFELTNTSVLPNYVGVRVSFSTTVVSVTENNIHNMLTGIEVGSLVNSLTISQNSIHNNSASGIAFSGGSLSGITVEENSIFSNATSDANAAGIRFLATFSSATNSMDSFARNSFSGNSNFGAVRNESPDTLNFANCWWGNSSGPSSGYTGTGDAITAGVDFSPWLQFSTDTDLVTYGFQPDRSRLNVDDDSPLTTGVTTGYINEAVASIVNGSLTGGARRIDVRAGTYTEQVVVDKALSLLGPNEANDPTDLGARVAEAIVRPDETDPDPFDANDVSVIVVSASNVTIRGMLIDGNNTLISSGVTLTGAGDVDAEAGIRSFGEVDNISIQNNIVRNVSYIGIDFGTHDGSGIPNDGVAAAVNPDNSIASNLIQNVGAYNDEGTGVRIRNNFYANVSSNDLENVRMGIETGNFSAANTGGAVAIDANEIQARRRGVFYNLHYGTASTIAVTNNVIAAIADAAWGASLWTGVYLITQQGTVTATFQDNDIDGTGNTYAPLSAGYTVLATNATASSTIGGGTVVDVDYGVWVTNVGPNGFGDATANMHVTVSGVDITASTYGVFVDYNSGNGFQVAATITGNTSVSTGGAGAGIRVSGVNASADINNNNASILDNDIGIDVNAGSATITNNRIYDNNTGVRFTNGGSGSLTTNSFENGTDNGTDLRLDSSAGTVTINAGNDFRGDNYFIDNESNQSFNLYGGNAQTYDEANNFRIEDKMRHRIDTDLAVSVGLITWVQNNVYVTSAGTDHSIQRGVDSATAGDTVNVEAGTYIENVSVGKRLTIDGAGSTASDTVVKSAAIDVPVFTYTVGGVNAGTRQTIKDIRIQDGFSATPGAQGASGILYTTSSASGYFTLDNVVSTNNVGHGLVFNNSSNISDVAIVNSAFSNNSNGILIRGGGYLFDGLSISGSSFTGNDVLGFSFNPNQDSSLNGDNFSITTTTFTQNGDLSYTQPVSPVPQLGRGDIGFQFYNGNATLTDVTVTGLPTNGAHIGVQFRGDNTVAPAGTITLTNVAISGSYVRPLNHPTLGGGPGGGLYIQNYTDVSGFSFNNVDLLTTEGHQLFVAGVTNTLNLGATDFGATLGAGGFHVALGTTSQNVGALSPVDATGAFFGGVNGGSATLTQLYTIENRILHGVDDPALGLVRVKANRTFVTPNSFFAPATTVANIQRAINLASSGDTVHVQGGSYTGNVTGAGKAITLDLGASTAIVAITGDFTLDSDDTLALEIDGSTPGTLHDQLDVTGAVSLGSSILTTSSTIASVPGQTLTIIANDGGDAVTGIFGVYAEGATVVVNGINFVISYAGGTGNDVSLTQLGDFVWTETVAGSDFELLLLENGVVDTLQLRRNGIAVDSRPFNAVTSFVLNGIAADTDTLKVNYSATGGYFSLPVFFHGGAAGNDMLAVAGSGQNATYSPDLSVPGNGTVVVDSSTITFTGLEPVDISGMLTATLLTLGANDLLTVANGFDFATSTINAMNVFGTSGGVGIEAVAFWNNTTVVIDTTFNDGVDSILVAGINGVAQNNANVTISSGAGADALTVSIVVNLTGTFTANVSTVNLNANVTAATITGTATTVFVDDNPSGQIQDGIDVAAPGATVNVLAGTFNENVLVNEQVTIVGAGEASTFVRPSFSGANPGGLVSLPFGHSSVFLIQANNVTIRDLTVDGDNPGLTSGIVIGGADIDARNGIITDHTMFATIANLTVDDVTVKNIYLRGIYASTSAGTFTFTDNTVQNVRGDAGSIAIFNFGGSGLIQNNSVDDANDGIAANWSMGTQFLNNIVTNSDSGIHSDNAGGAGGTNDLIQLNQVLNGSYPGGSYGIFVFAPYLSVTVDQNTVTDVDVGLGAFGGFGGSALFTDNTVDANNRPGSLGAWVSTTLFTFGSANVDASFTANNTIFNADTGIQVDEEVGYVATVLVSGNNLSIYGNLIGIDVTGGTVTITNNTIYDNGIGIRFGTGGAGSVTGNDFDDATDDNDTDLQILSTAGAVAVGAGNAFAGDVFYIDNLSTQDIDLVTFAQTYDVAGVDVNFRIEDLMHHRMDDDLALGNGLITWVANNLFVTDAGTDHDIQRGVDAATAGNVVNVETGTYAPTVVQPPSVGGNPAGLIAVNKSVTIIGIDTGLGLPTITSSAAGAAPGIGRAIFDVSATNVLLQDLLINVVRPNATAGIQAFTSFGGLTIDGVTMRSFGSGGFYAPPTPAGPPATSSAGINIMNIDGGSPLVTITDTAVLPDNNITPTSIFGRAVYLQTTRATISGNPLFHAFVGVGQDLQITDASAGVTSISGILFPSAGVSIVGTLTGATVNLTGNVFDQPSIGLPFFPDKSLAISTSSLGTVNVENNVFQDVQSGKFAVVSGASKNVTIKGNLFTAAAGAVNFTYILTTSSYLSSNPTAVIPDNSITIIGNTFSAAGGTSGRALDFQHGNTSGASGWGTITIGTATPGEENTFGNLAEFIRLSPTPIPSPTVVNLFPGAFAPNLNVANNEFDLGGGPLFPASFTLADNFAMENRVFHKIDNGTVGLVLWTANNVYVTPAAVPTATDNDYTRLRNALDAVADGYTINLLGTFNWVEANAAASWALGNDDTASTADDYSLRVPVGLDSVTFTAPGGLGTATIQGPGDLATVNLEGVLLFDQGVHQNWTISNLQFYDFDLSIAFFATGVSDFNGTQVLNNRIRIPVDLNATVAPIDVNQNIGIHYSFGTNQTFAGNIFELIGAGVSDSANNRFSTRVAMQSNTSGGAVYDGLLIDSNVTNVYDAQFAANPELILGIWENAHAHSSDIVVSNNQFNNLHVGNDPTINLQRAFRVTSHSSASTTVTYSGNTVNGANMGFQWITGTNFAGNLPVQLLGNTLNDVNTGVLVQSNGLAHLSNNDLTNTGSMLGLGTGVSVVSGSTLYLDDAVDDNNLIGFATGVLVNGAATISGNDNSIHGNVIGIDVAGGTATISANHIYDNTTGVRFTAAGSGSVTGNDFDGPALDNDTDLRLDSTAGVVSFVGAANTFAGDDYFIDNRSAQNFDLVANPQTYEGYNPVLLPFANNDNFGIEDHMHHKLDSATAGLTRWSSGNLFVTTPSSGASDETIQRAINAASSFDTIYVQAGSYLEAIDFTGKTNLLLLGAGIDTSYIVGQKADGKPHTVWMNSSNNTVDGFTITRDGNNPTDWNTNDTNHGVVFDSAGTGNILRNSKLWRNRNGIIVANASGNTVTRTIIDDNRTGINFQDASHNNTFTENFITNNWTFGVIFIDVSGNSSGNTFYNNHFSDNWYSQVEDQSTSGSNIRNFSGNWFGSTTPSRTVVNTSTPGYSSQIPVHLGGSAVAPGSPVIIGGISSSKFDYTPYLMSGSDTALATPGFQGSFAVLTVTADASQYQSVSRVQEGYDEVTSGGLVHILAGTYAGNVTTGVKAATLSPGASPAIVTIGGDFTLSAAVTLAMELNGAAPGTGYDQFVVNGIVALNNATISLTRTFAYTTGSQITLIANDNVDLVGGTFNGVADNATVVVVGLPFRMTYNQFNSPQNNDVVLVLDQPTTVWVNENWAIFVDSDLSSSLTVGDIVDNTGVGDDGSVLGKIFGYDAYATIQTGIGGVAATGTVYILSGIYDEYVTVNKTVTLDGVAAPTTPYLTRTAGGGGALITVISPNVTIRDLALNANRPFANDAIYADDSLGNFNGLSVLNNTFTSSGAGGTSIHTGAGSRGVGIGLIGNGGIVESATIQGNSVLAGPVSFTRAVWTREVSATVGGSLVAEGNALFGTFQDLLLAFAGPTTNLIQNNLFTGAGMDVTEPSPGATVVNIWNNIFAPVSPLFSQSLLVKHNYDATAAVNVANNVFTGHTIGAYIGGSRNVTLTGNSFTPDVAVLNYRNVIVDTLWPGSLAPPYVLNDIVLTDNTFNGNSAIGAAGYGVLFRNALATSTPNPDFSSIVLGTGALPNKFAADLTRFIVLDPTDSTVEDAPFAIDINAQNNQFDVGSGLQLPAAMTLAQRFSLEDKIIHEIDVATLGLVTVVPGQVFVTTNSFFAPFTTTPSIQRGVDAATAGDIVNVANGLYFESVTVNKAVTVDGESQAGVIIAPPTEDANLDDSFAGAPVNAFNVIVSGATIRDLTIDGQANPLLTVGKNNFRAGIMTPDNFVDLSDLTFDNLVVKNFYRRGIQINWTGDNNAITNNTVYQTTGAKSPGSYGIAVFGPAGVVSVATLVAENYVYDVVETGISSNYGAFLTIRNNTVSNNGVGMNLAAMAAGSMVGGTTAGTAGVGGTGDGNLVQSNGTGQIGILVTFSLDLVTIQNNTVTGSGTDAGIWLFNNAAVATQVLDNTLTATGSVAGSSGEATGIYVTDFVSGEGTPTGNLATILRNSITGFQVGIDVNAQRTEATSVTVTIGGATVADDNSIVGPAGGTGIRVYDFDGALNGYEANATIQNNNASISGFLVGIDVNGGNATITANHIFDNGTGIVFRNAGTGSVTGNNFDDAIDNDTDLQVQASAGLVSIGAANNFAGNTFYIDNLSTQNFNLFGLNAQTYDVAGPDVNFRIEDLMHHRVDTDLLVTNGLITWVANNVYVTDASTDHDIQRGVDAATAGDTVNVEDGTYALIAPVNINKTVTILGAQAGVDARTRTLAPESIVDATGVSGYPTAVFRVLAGVGSVVIDGFTLQNAVGGFAEGAISLAPTSFGTTIQNNIIRNNTVGIFLANNSALNATVVFQNLFLDNTQPGPASGHSIYADNFTAGAMQNVEITDNKFTNTAFTLGSWAIGLGSFGGTPFADITIDGNEIVNHGRGMDFFHTTGTNIWNNTVTGATRYAVGIFGANGVAANSNFSVDGNTFAGNGKSVYIEADTAADAYTGGTLSLTNNSFTTVGAEISIYNDSNTRVDATDNVFNGVDTSGPTTTAQQYVIVDTIVDAVDIGAHPTGLVVTKTGHVYVTTNSYFEDLILSLPYTQLGTTQPDIQRAVNAASNGDVVHVQGGVYFGSVNTSAVSVTLDLGSSPAQVTVNGDWTLDGDDTLAVEFVDNTAAGVDYDQLVVNGLVDLGGAALAPSIGSGLVNIADSFTLIANNLVDPVTGNFAGKPQASTFMVGAQVFVIFYNGGTGNDVVLMRVPALTPTQVWVDDNWVGTTAGVDADGVGGGVLGNGYAFGYDQFAVIQDGVNAVATAGTVWVYAGTYIENVVINDQMNLWGEQYLVNPVTTLRGPEANIAPASGIGVHVTAAAAVSIRGFSILADSGISDPGADLDVQNNIVTALTIGVGTGVAISSANSAVVSNNVIDDFLWGVYGFTVATNVTIQGNDIGNVALGIYMNDVGGVVQVGGLTAGEENTIVGAGAATDDGIVVIDSADVAIEGNIVSSVGYGVYLESSGTGGNPVGVVANDLTGLNAGIGVWLNGTVSAVYADILGNDVGGFNFGVFLFSGGGNVVDATIGGPLPADSNDIVGYIGADTGIRVEGANATADINGNVTSIHGFQFGVDVSGASASISGNHIYDNEFGVRFANGGSGSVFGNDFNDAVVDVGQDNDTDLRINSTAGPVSVVGAANSFAGDDYFFDNRSTQTFDLVANPQTYEGYNPVLLPFVNNDNFGIEDHMHHTLDDATTGLIRWSTGNLFVTTPGTGPTGELIQNAVDASGTLGDTVYVQAGVYVQEVNVNKANLLLIGAGAGTTTLSGPFGGDSATVRVSANNVEVTGFTITREGNNSIDWFNPALKSAGIAIIGPSLTGMLVHDNILTGNRTAIDVNNTSGHTIRNNVIDYNRTGLLFRNQTDNLLVTQNDITNNWTMGVLFLDASGGSNIPVQTALNSSFTNNNISGNWYAGVVDRQSGGSLPAPGTTNLKNFSGNWWGTNAPVPTLANSAEMGYGASPIPAGYPGGSATNPGGAPDIAGPASGNIDFTPWLDSGVDTNVDTGFGTFGFQGNFNNLWVTSSIYAGLSNAQTGASGRIQEGHDLATAGGLVHILGGTYTENLDTTNLSKAVTLSPGASPAIVTVNGNFTLDGDITVAMELNGAAPGTGYDQFVINGLLDLGNANLTLTRTHVFTIGSSITLFSNDLADVTPNTFTGYPEGSTILATGVPFTISYVGLPGANDVILSLDFQLETWVNDTWFINVDIGPSGLSYGDTVSDNGGNDPVVSGKVFGVSAFSTLQAGHDALVPSGGTEYIMTGTYAQNLSVSKSNTLVRALIGTAPVTVNPAAGTAIAIQAAGVSLDSSSLADDFVVQGNATANRIGVFVNAANADLQDLTVQGFSGAGSSGVRVSTIGSAALYSNTIQNNNVGVRIIGGAALFQDNAMPNNNSNGVNSAAVVVQNDAYVDLGQEIDGSQTNYTGLGISTGGNTFNYSATAGIGYWMGGAQAIVNINADSGSPSGPNNVGWPNVSARNNDFGTTVYGNIERIVNHQIDTPFVAMVDFRDAVGAVAPQLEGAVRYYAVGPNDDLVSQRSLVRGAQFVIDSPVVLNAGAVGVERLNINNGDYYWYTMALPTGAVPISFTSSVDGLTGRTTVTITFTGATVSFGGFLEDLGGSLIDGRYRTTLSANNIDLLFSGQTAASSKFNSNVDVFDDFHRFYGDIDGDTFLGGSEINALFDAYSSLSSAYMRYYDFQYLGFTFNVNYNIDRFIDRIIFGGFLP